jgi:hypothetical protein
MIWGHALVRPQANGTRRKRFPSRHSRHTRPGDEEHPQRQADYVGTPTTWVFAAARTRQAVVDALTNGRVAVSANPYAPRVEFYADLDQDGKMDMMMGDNAKSSGKSVRFRIQLTGHALEETPYIVNVVKDGNKFGTFQTPGATAAVEFTDTPDPVGRTYYRVEVHGPATPYPQVPDSTKYSEDMVGLSNPIYFNFDPNF